MVELIFQKNLEPLYYQDDWRWLKPSALSVCSLRNSASCILLYSSGAPAHSWRGAVFAHTWMDASIAYGVCDAKQTEFGPKLFSRQRPVMPDPSLPLSLPALHSVSPPSLWQPAPNCHCVGVCSQLKVSPAPLMDPPSPPWGPLPSPRRCLSSGWRWVTAGRGGDRTDNGRFVLRLDVSKPSSCGPGDAWSNRDTQRLWKRLAAAHSPRSPCHPASTQHLLQPNAAELLPSQPFRHIKALSHPVGTLTFAFCWIQRFCFNTTGFFFSIFLSRFITLKLYTPSQSTWASLLSRVFNSGNSLSLQATQASFHWSQHGRGFRHPLKQVAHFAFNSMFFFSLAWLIDSFSSWEVLPPVIGLLTFAGKDPRLHGE